MFAITRLPSPRMDQCQLTYAPRDPINYERAVEQHAGYRDMLRQCGAEVLTLPALAAFPDCHFVEDTAVVLDEVAILAWPGAPARQGEVATMAEALARHRTVKKIADMHGATLDGGDVLPVARSLYVGRSTRTNEAGITALRTLAEPHGYRVQPIQVRDCLHLRSAFTALDDNTLVINRNWVTDPALAALARDYELVHISADEPAAGDILRIGDVIVMQAAHEKTADLIAKRGYTVKTVELSEFAKAEGGVTCLSLIFN